MRNTLRFYFLVLFSLPALMQAQGYYNQENFGNRSLLLSGAVTGSVEDLGLTYYNPARIALVENPVFSINAKAYQTSTINLKNAFGRDNKFSDSRFEGVPSLLAGTVKLGKSDKHKFAYAFLTKENARLDINARRENLEGGIVDEVEEIDRLASSLEIDNTVKDEWFGATWGTKIKDNLSIGASMFVSVFNYNGKYDLRLAALDTIQDVLFYNNAINFKQSSYGIFWKVGMAWKLKKVDIGVNIDLPFIEVYKKGEFRYGEFLSGYGEGDDIYSYGQLKDLETNRKVPLAISFGAGIPLAKHKVHVKADWHGAVKEYDRMVIPLIDDGAGVNEPYAFKEELNSIINFGLGAEFFLKENMHLYASFSTDFSPIETNANIFDLAGDRDTEVTIAADYYHYGFGLDLKWKSAQITVGTTYSTARAKFERPIDLPDPDESNDVDFSDSQSELHYTRWRFIIGLEFPILGYNVDFK